MSEAHLAKDDNADDSAARYKNRANKQICR